jgi:hypothetical protein
VAVEGQRPMVARTSLCLMLPLLLATGAGAQDLRAASPTECLPLADDYGHVWWADGLPGRAGAPYERMVRTGRYAVSLDTANLAVPHLGVLAGGTDYLAAATEDNGAVTSLPGAELDLTITVAGRRYRCTEGGRLEQHSGPRLIEAGRFLQRTDITDLVFRSAEGDVLPVDAQLEQIAWPDRLTFLLEAQPARAPLVSGESFGRVGGGRGFAGDEGLAVEPGAELEPAVLTLELWAYIADEPPATTAYPWLYCANGNEWADGAYGLYLLGDSPHATLNIGGGRENCHAVAGSPLAREQWHHLAMTYDGSDLRLYVDGEVQARETIGQPRGAGPGTASIGRRDDGAGDGYHFRGYLDEIRLWRSALPPEGIRAHWASPERVAAADDLVREWTFNPGGVEAAVRPRAELRDATMAIRLGVGGTEVAESLPAVPLWAGGDAKHVSVSLAPGGTGMERAPSETPCTVQAIAQGETAARPVEYDPVRRWYRVDLDGVVPEGAGNDSLERVRLTLANPSAEEQPVRLLLAKGHGGIRVQGYDGVVGLTPMLRDADGYPLGVPVQISKNWHALAGRNLKYQGPWFHGLTMLRLPARSRVELEFALTYAHWGGVAAASHSQLCLIGWGSNQLWEQSALGSWGESICYEPDQAQADCGILDVRPLMVYGGSPEAPAEWTWTSNVGGGDFFRLFGPAGERLFPTRMRSAYRRYGPVLTEVTHAGMLGAAQLRHRETVSIYRSDDVVRGVYRIRLDADEATDFSRLVLFQIGADSYSYTHERRLAVGDATGLTREWDAQWGGDVYRTAPAELTGDAPWVSLHEGVPQAGAQTGAWANRGIVIRSWRARLGGREAAPWFAERGVNARGVDVSTIDIVPPPGVSRLEPGDFVEATIEHVIMPQFARDYYGPNGGLRAALEAGENTWRMIWREAASNRVDAEVTLGSLREAYPLRIEANGGRAAEFALTGGLGYYPVTICGLASYRALVLEQQGTGGAWTVVDQSVHGRDFWQTDRDPATGTWEMTYTLPLDSPGDARQTRRFRFRLD